MNIRKTLGIKFLNSFDVLKENGPKRRNKDNIAKTEKKVKSDANHRIHRISPGRNQSSMKETLKKGNVKAPPLSKLHTPSN